ncbi:hypothetical protein ABEB36_004932 [Hypothenemus hampei]|uniref:Uncharacterized protein n=1 Tax=Hypothenemus hampei TaxID=57062 RepID=A0ABD1EWC7_HYPHA
MSETSGEKKSPKRKRHQHLKLPTPPPDPWKKADDEIKNERSPSVVSDKDREMFEYIESLHRNVYSRSTSSTVFTEEAFDHLEKLYKLMEQMLDLREQNFKLHRRIRDLEHLNNLEKLNINVREEYPDLEKDTVFAEAILDSILQDPRNKELPKIRNFRSSILKRSRNNSATERQLSEASNTLVAKETEKPSSSSKISKWTKVKAAFKWEKASNVGDSTSKQIQDHIPINYEIARYLRVPSTGDELLVGHHSPAGDSGAGISTPGTVSSTSSNDDLRLGHRTSEDEDEDGNLHPTNLKCQKSPWAKMKDIIHTRNSLKKKPQHHRFSAASDDIHIDVEFCSDNDEDVFEADADSGRDKSLNVSLSPSPNVYSNSASPNSSDIPPDVIERYQMALAEDSASDCDIKPSRWNRVRKAFLSRDHKKSSTIKKLEESTLQDEIQSNYKKLQKKLSLEFQEKMSEWERMKQHSPGDETCRKISEDERRRVPMTREYDLPEDFKKKLQEWERMKKSGSKKKLGETKWKSIGGPSSRSSDHSPVFEYPALTDDFRKKLDEWRQIKASGGPGRVKDKSPSPKLSRKNSSKKGNKERHHRELHWFEKELGKIEKEKQRLERERQKFIDREERLSKLRRSMMGSSPKKEILIHTPSGFHRFEGISRKFTQKLYEWEKAQGIAPEASTFALLYKRADLQPSLQNYPNNKKEPLGATSIPRSKSADSIAISALNLTCPLLSGHPSSLSLNDMEELEKECLANSKTSSLHDLEDPDDEPQAVLVEVEDYEEETTKPLHILSCVDRQQLPVYQRQECKPLCESETVIFPKIRRSAQSEKARGSYDLLEVLVKILNELQDVEEDIADGNEEDFKVLNEAQRETLKKAEDILDSLKDTNELFITDLLKGNPSIEVNLIEGLRDKFNELKLKVNSVQMIISDRLTNQTIVMNEVKGIKTKISELRLKLTELCASEECKKPNRYLKVEGNLSVGQGAVKKRIRHRQKGLKFPMADSDDDEDLELPQRSHKKLSRVSRSVSDEENGPQLPLSESAVTLFVKTTRKLFTPIVETSLKRSGDSIVEGTARNQDEMGKTASERPPLPSSPVLQRKVYKDVSPGIKLMLAKYNQNVEQLAGLKSGGSSGSNSPTTWRSPVLERKIVREQRAKYQEKLSPLIGEKRHGVQKSSSASLVHKQLTIPERKTSLADSASSSCQTDNKSNLFLDFSVAKPEFSPEVRMRRLQKAKEEFLQTPISAPITLNCDMFKFPERNRLSQTSVDSDEDTIEMPGSIIKSASAGMINVDLDVYNRIDPEYRSEGYVSLPRQMKKFKDATAFHTIASKFRKVKMRKGKEKGDNKQTVATLCRQSLLVNIHNDINGDIIQKEPEGEQKSGGSWIKRSLFKK